MKILLKLFKGILWLLLLLLVLALLTLLSWWMQWPLATGAVILLALFGLVLAFIVARALYRLHDKTRFVHKVLDEQSAIEAASPAVLGRMAYAWQQGMEVLRASPQRFHERMEFSQPWFVTLDASGSSSNLFASMGETRPETPDSPLFWHFLPASVLLRCPEAQLSQEDWQELLTNLSKKGRHIPLRGIVLLLSITDIARRSSEELAVLGRNLRTRVQQLMLAMNRRYPVYVLLQGIESLPGMDKILDIVPASEFNTALGEAHHAPASMSTAAETAALRLEDMIRDAAAGEHQPEGDMLEALRSLRTLGGKLHLVTEQLSREVAHQVQLQLDGVCFCQGESTEGRPPAFLTGLLSHVLPSSVSPAPLMRGLPFVANTRACLMGAWLLLLLGLCGLMGVNVIYQHQALTEAAPAAPGIAHDPETDRLYQQMLYIRQLEKTRKAWYLPKFGQDALSRALNASRSDFTGKIYQKILSPLLTQYRSGLSGLKSMTRSQEREMRSEIMWLTAVASDRINNENMAVEKNRSFPITSQDTRLWNPVIGRLIVNAIHWMADGEQVDTFTREMRALLAESLRQKGNSALDDMLDDINSRYPAAAVCLAQFWPHVNSSDPNNVCVPPAYTRTGYKVFGEVLEDLNSLDEPGGAIRQSASAFRSEYFRRYAELWPNFTRAFANIRASMQEGDVFVSYADISKIEDMPHYRALQQLTSELTPLRDAGKDSPHWLSNCMLMDVVVDIAEFEHRQEVSSRVRALLSLVASAPELMQRLRAETKDARQARRMLEIAENMKAYFDNSLALLPVMASPKQSYALAASWFGGRRLASQRATLESNGKAQEWGPEDLYNEAKKELESITTPFKGNGWNPMLELLPGILDFIAQGVTVQAAKVVQEAWENEVLGSAAALYRQDDVTALYGDKGVVQTFVNARLKPFLTRRGKNLSAASWGGIVFPFTGDGLNVLSQAEMIAAQPPEDTYYVQLRSQPTLVNVDAKERVDATTLTLQCEDKVYSLVNRNYPRDEKFQYTVKKCSATTLEIDFPSFTLTRVYETFADFLKEFQYGTRNFSQKDFEDAEGVMETAGVKNVTVRILPDGVSSVLQKEGGTPPTLPDRITYVW